MTSTAHLRLVDLTALSMSGMVSTRNDSVSSASKHMFCLSFMIYCCCTLFSKAKWKNTCPNHYTLDSTPRSRLGDRREAKLIWVDLIYDVHPCSSSRGLAIVAVAGVQRSYRWGLFAFWKIRLNWRYDSTEMSTRKASLSNHGLSKHLVIPVIGRVLRVVMRVILKYGTSSQKMATIAECHTHRATHC